MTAHGSARADEPTWARGVSEDRKQHAHALLDAGNALFVDNNYAEALAKYREALAVWDHPAIRFNIVRCLILLERTIEAWDNLELALRYGAEPLEPTVFEEALAFRKLLAKQIGQLEVTCEQPGIKLVLDGAPLGTCPAHEARRLLPGPHAIVGSLAGYLTKSLEVVVVGGGRATAEISLVRLSDAARVTHRWPIWIPWLVAGAGAAVAGIGGLVEVKARSDQDLYQRSVARDCSMMACTPDPLVAGLHDSAVSENRLGIVAASLGLAAVVTGGVMLYLNRAHLDYDISAGAAIVRLRIAM
jgi:hypothetical protein